MSRSRSVKSSFGLVVWAFGLVCVMGPVGGQTPGDASAMIKTLHAGNAVLCTARDGTPVSILRTQPANPFAAGKSGGAAVDKAAGAPEKNGSPCSCTDWIEGAEVPLNTLDDDPGTPEAELEPIRITRYTGR